ncbi:heme NO-binding domain-containing protein [Pseudorhodobacter sp. W20_MBD10_FR17]|uniref:heme NO-binding domain-containing protein n=1 Tax=Pseudorhodobacter sp. W20_MBD10_FR17 TaxID=3240266 RepID=UPI003F96A556
MRGTIFVELIKMAEETFGEDVVDEVLEKADLDNDGAFTTVGNYPCSELVKIVMALSAHSSISPEVLQRKFGHWMINHFVENFPAFFEGKADSFAMLESVDGEIHVEVAKLYPDAELPVFETKRLAPDHLIMTYSSPRPLVEFCHGMIEACLDLFSQSADIQRMAVPTPANATRFDIRLTA